MTTSAAASEWTVEPFHMGTADEFARFRALLVRSGFTEAAICGVAGVPSMHHYPVADEARRVFRAPSDPQALLALLFLDGASVPWSVVEELLPEADRQVIEALGLLVASPRVQGHCETSLCLYPTNGVYIASDRYVAPHVSGANPPADLVYSAMTKETYRVLSLMPRIPCGDYLELCSGTGVAALIAAAHYATRAVAIDVTERSTQFARFNIALNGLSNVTALQGDLYAPVAGRTFDLIVAHPPYMPSFETEYVYRDAGEDGEQVTRGAISELPRYLRPGGQFFCDCLMSDRADRPVEERVRGMLGEHAGEFDIVIGESTSFEPVAYYTEKARQGKISFSSVERRNETFSRLGIKRFVAVTILLGRRAAPRSVATVRRLLSPATGRDEFQWLLRWSGAAASWDAYDARHLLDSRPLANARVELRSTSFIREGRLSVEEFRLVTDAPFAVEVRGPLWLADLLVWCDGVATARDHMVRLQTLGIVPPDGDDAFVSVIRQLVDAGVLEIDEFRLPEPARTRAAVEVASQSPSPVG